MRFLYICRQFNRSGYYILKSLLQGGKHLPLMVMLPQPHLPELIDEPEQLNAVREEYLEEVAYYGCQPLRCFKSIRSLADDYNIPVVERQEIKSDRAYEWLESLDLDLIVLGGGWKQLIPKRIINLPRYGILNTHPSLLPNFRGTDVHRWQIYEGATISGITVHYLDESFDTGDILGQVEVEVTDRDTPQDIAEKTGRVAGGLMVRILDKIAETIPDRLLGKPQTHLDDRSRYYSRWRWDNLEFLRIDWSRSARDISNFVRSCSQESYKYNGAFFFVCDKQYILRQTIIEKYIGGGESGEILRIDNKGILVYCRDDGEALLITQIQPTTAEGWRNLFHSEPAIEPNSLMETIGLRVGDRLESSLMEKTIDE
jgi:methionyl-tRNA formyltransferase